MEIKIEEIAIVISIVSLALALWSRRVAEKANSITKHHYQLEIYDVFFNLRSYTDHSGAKLNSNEIQKYKYLLKNTRFYFDNKFDIQLNNYCQNCYMYAVLHMRYLENSRNEEDMENILNKQDLLESERIKLTVIIEKQFNTYLKI